MNKIKSLLLLKKLKLITSLSIIVIALVAGLTLVLVHASTSNSGTEAETGSLASCASSLSDSSASGSNAVQFASCASNPSAGAGSSLPINYSLSSLTGQVLYVSTTGSDSNSGSVSAPFATLNKAVDVANSGATIVIRGGTYHQGDIGINKGSLTIEAYPGEKPVFDGSVGVSSTSGWTTEGSLSYRSYTPMPVTDGSGISFTTCQNQNSSTNCVGRYPDQLWMGPSQYKQVYAKTDMASGKFWVDQTNDRLYMETTDLDNGSIAVSDLDWFLHINAPNNTIRGLKVVRYSNTANDYGVISVYGPADNTLLDNMFISDSSFLAASFSPNADTNENSTIKDSTIIYSNWMGVNANQTTSFTIDHCKIGHMNQFDEFSASPASGSLKTSRTWYTKVLNSQIMDNTDTNGLWFDQSNYKTTVAGNDIEGIDGASVFYEISDFLYMVNNYIKAPSGSVWAARFIGSSNLYVANNTILGAYPVAMGMDNRSIAGCSDPTKPLCDDSYSSDRDSNSAHPHPATLTWMPSVDLLINNVLAYPTASQSFCGQSTNFCVTADDIYSGGSPTTTLDTIFHAADSANGVPQTYIDGNVYANGSGSVISIRNQSGQWSRYNNGTSFGAAMAGSPVNISGFGAHSYTGNQYVNSDGTPTSALQSLMGNAVAVPTNSYMNPYLPAGTKHYGVLWY